MKAILTWNCLGVTVKEVVEMVPEDVPVYGVTEQGAVTLPYTTKDMLDNTNLVFFEDTNGIFGLRPEWVISIKPITEVDMAKLKAFLSNKLTRLTLVLIGAAALAAAVKKAKNG